MDKQIYITNLYDIYYKLLTEKQQKYFEDYYFENLSLKEISENYSVSRNAIYNVIKEVEEKLNYYENNLKKKEKTNKIKEVVTKIEDKKVIKEIENILD